MTWPYRACSLAAGAVVAAGMAVAPAASATAASAATTAPVTTTTPAAAPGSQTIIPPVLVKGLGGTLSNGEPKVSATAPTGLSPSAIQSAYNLSGLSDPNAGAGQTIAIVDAYDDPNALSDLNTFSTEYGLPTLPQCSSLSQSGGCFEKAYPSGVAIPDPTGSWELEESLDIEWAHAEAPAAKIVLVEALLPSTSSLYDAVSYANSLGANEVSMSWGGSESSDETSDDSYFTNPGTLYTVSAGDSGHGAEAPAESPNVVSVGGTTLNGCSGTSCSGFTGESAWSDSGGGASAYEPVPSYQSGYTGPVYGASTISGLTGGYRGVPDVSFEADPNTGVSIYDSTPYDLTESGWFTVGGTSVGAPNWAGILAAGAAAGDTALQGDDNIYSGGYSSNLRDATSGTNGTCGTDCTAGTGYDLVTGLGSPVNYP
jgi:subtilase family serine protease